MTERVRTPEEISASITRYYDSLTDEDVADDRAWGEFAMAQLVAGKSWDDDGTAGT